MASFRKAFDQQQQSPDLPQFEDTLNVTPNLPFPMVSLRHIDFAIKKWFEKDMPISVTDFSNQPKQVEIIWAAEERWAMMQLNNDVRDKNGTLKLPIISLRRAAIEPMFERSVPSDKEGTANIKLFVQEYINPTTDQKEYIVSANKTTTFPIVEIIEIQPPKMVKVTYNVFFWANYMDDMRIMLEHMILYFGNQHAIFYNENLWFSAFLQGISNDSNDLSIQQDERVFKTSFTISVEAPLIDRRSIKRYRTQQGIDFKMEVKNDIDFKDKQKIKKFLDDGSLWYSPYRFK